MTNEMYHLTLQSLHKAYALPAPLLSRKGQRFKTKQALAGVSLTLGPGLYGLLGPLGGMENSSCVESRTGSSEIIIIIMTC